MLQHDIFQFTHSEQSSSEVWKTPPWYGWQKKTQKNNLFILVWPYPLILSHKHRFLRHAGRAKREFTERWLSWNYRERQREEIQTAAWKKLAASPNETHQIRIIVEGRVLIGSGTVQTFRYSYTSGLTGPWMDSSSLTDKTSEIGLSLKGTCANKTAGIC